jgi:transposase-like protein
VLCQTTKKCAGVAPIREFGHKYVLVMIEHFSKWIELVALPDKFSEGVAYSFLDRVLSRFGAPAEVLTDQDAFASLSILLSYRPHQQRNSQGSCKPSSWHLKT